MCLPGAIAADALAKGLAVVQAASTTLSIVGQNQAASAEADAARNATIADYNTLQEQERQVNNQSTLERMERMRQAQRERARLRVAMGESGLDGVSPLREINNSFLQESYDIGVMQENKENKIHMNTLQKESAYATGRGRYNAAKSRMVNPLLGALMIGGSGIEGYGSGFQLGQTLKGK